MEWVFRSLPEESPRAGHGELLILASEEGRRRGRTLATDVFELGLEALVSGEAPIRRFVLRHDSNLDDCLAATFASWLLEGRNLPAGAEAFAKYAGMVRGGFTPGSKWLVTSLESIHLAIRHGAGRDLVNPVIGARFAADWDRLGRLVKRAAEAGVDPFLAPLVEEGAEFAREIEFLRRDREVYAEDVARGRTWRARFPAGPARGSILVLEEPRSMLWKLWSRMPGSDGSLAPVLLGLKAENKEWAFSTDPALRIDLRFLHERLQAAETAVDPEKAVRDPWFDGAPFDYTLVAAPRSGTSLPADEVLRIVHGCVGTGGGRVRRIALPSAAVGLLLAGAALGFHLAGSSGEDEAAPRGTRPAYGPGPGPVPMEVPWEAGVTVGRDVEVDGELVRGLIEESTDEVFPSSASLELRLPPGTTTVAFRASNAHSVPRPVRVWATCVPSRSEQGIEVVLTVNGAVPTLRPEGLPGGTAALDPGSGNTIEAHVWNRSSLTVDATLTVHWQLDYVKKLDLCLLAIGISEYGDPRLRLHYADDDARAIVDAFRTQEGEGRLFQRVTVIGGRPLLDGEATRASILAAFEAMEREATQHHLAVITFSGHGVTDPREQFYCLPADYSPEDSLVVGAVSWRDIETFLEGFPCQVLLIMDTCQSGTITILGGARGTFEEGIERAVEDFIESPKGTWVMAASLGDESAKERPEWKHGALTLAVLEGLTGAYLTEGATERLPHQTSPDGIVTLKRLDTFVTYRVKELTDGSQHVNTGHTGNLSLDRIPIAALRP